MSNDPVRPRAAQRIGGACFSLRDLPMCERCSHIVTKTEEKSLQVKERARGQSFAHSPAPMSMFLRNVNYTHLGSSSDSSEPPPTSLVWISLGPCRISSHSFLKSLLCAYFEVFCEGKMSKTNQNLCSLLTNFAHWIFFTTQPARELLWNEVLLLYMCAMYVWSYLLPRMENPSVADLQSLCALLGAAAMYLHFIAHFCISDSSGRGEFSSYFIKPICSYRSWLRNLAGRLATGTF